MNRKLTLTKQLVSWIAIAAFLIPTLSIELLVLPTTNWTFAYPIDDTFIHLAIAKNLAFHHVWGISPHEFVSAASSLLYPVILAISLKIFGSHIIIPFIINLLAGIILLIILQKWLIKQEISHAAQMWILLAVIFFTPLPVLAMSGMEHILQFLFSFLFVTTFCDELAKLPHSDNNGWKLSWKIYLYGILMITIRYEGIPLLAIASMALLIHRKFFLSFQLGFICALPVILFGLYSVYMGSHQIVDQARGRIGQISVRNGYVGRIKHCIRHSNLP